MLPEASEPDALSLSHSSPKNHSTSSHFFSGLDKAYDLESSSTTDLGFDEETIKETPPRPSHIRQGSSEPKSLGEVIDEERRRSGSPTLRYSKGRFERSPTPVAMANGNGAAQNQAESYADVAKEVLPAEGTGPNAIPEGARPATPATHKNEDGDGDFSGIGEDASPRSPTRDKAHRRVASRSKANRNVPGPKQGSSENDRPKQANGNDAYEKKEGDDQPKEVFYENYKNKSGENLASVKPLAGYEDSVQQRENKPAGGLITTDPTSEQDPSRNRPQHKHEPSQLTSGRRAGANWSRIRWAPLNVPFQRRLQTLMVLAHTLSIAGFLALFFLLCAIPILWPLIVPYLVYILLSNASTSGTLSYRSERLRRLPIFSLFASYFPARLHRTQELEPTRKYIFGYHPHGIISHGAFAAFATESLGFSTLFPGITNTLLTLDTNFRIPLYRDYALRMGLASVSRESCENLLSKGGTNGEGMGRAITIVVGGARESLDAEPFKLRCVLKKRKGFVKLAIRQGADLVPVMAFGENDLYDQFDAKRNPWIHKGQMVVKKLMGFTVSLKR